MSLNAGDSTIASNSAIPSEEEEQAHITTLERDTELVSEDTDETAEDQDACIALLALQQSPMIACGIPATPHTAAFRGLELELDPEQIWRIVEKVLRVKLRKNVISYSVSDVALDTIRKCTEEFVVHLSTQCAAVMNKRPKSCKDYEVGLKEVQSSVSLLTDSKWSGFSKTLDKMCGRQRKLQESLQVVHRLGYGSPSVLPTKREMASSPILSAQPSSKRKRDSYSTGDIIQDALGTLSMSKPNIHELKSLHAASIEVATSLVHSSLSNPFIESALRLVGSPAPGSTQFYSPAVRKRVVNTSLRTYPSSYSHTPVRHASNLSMPLVRLPPASGDGGEQLARAERYLTNQDGAGSRQQEPVESKDKDQPRTTSALEKLASFAALDAQVVP